MDKGQKFGRLFSRLDPQERAVVAAFLFVPQPVSIDTLSSLCSTSATFVLEVMERLKRRGLVLERRDLGRGVYALKDGDLESLRSLLPEDERRQTAERLVRFFEKGDGLGEDADLVLAELYRHAQPTLDRLEVIKRAADRLNRGPSRLKAVGYYDCIIDYLFPRDITSRREAELLVDSVIAKTYTLMHRMPASDQIRLLVRAGELAEAYGLDEELALVCLRLARAFQDSGDYRESSRYIDRFLSLADRIEDVNRRKLASHCLSEYYVWRGKFKEAIDCYEKMIGNIEEFEDDENALMATQLIGFSHVLCGRVSRGLGMIEAVRCKAEALGYKQVINYCDQAYAIAYLTLNRFEEAEKHIERLSQVPADDLGDILSWAVLVHRGYLLCLKGDDEGALECLRRAIALQEQKGRVFPPYPWLFETVRLLEDRGLRDPRVNLERVLGTALEREDLYVRGVALRYRAMRYLEDGDDRALACFLNSERYLRYSGAQIELARTRIALARYYLQKGEVKKARPYLEKAWRTLSAVDTSLFPEDLIGYVSHGQRAEIIVNRVIRLNELVEGAKEPYLLLEGALNIAMDITLAMRGAFVRDSEGGPAVVVSRNVDPNVFSSEKVRGVVAEVLSRGGEVVLDPRDSLGRPVICLPVRLAEGPWGCLYLEGKVDNEPFDPDVIPFVRLLCSQVALALNAVRLQEEYEALRLGEQVAVEDQEEEFPIIGESQAIRKVIEQIKQVAPTDATVLILGETGVGKELVARTIHNLSGRRSGPFIGVNLAAIPQDLIASELFGHERGAFTGAYERQRGLLELADGGTVFFDEIGDLPLTIQVKLLRVLEEGAFSRLGSAKLIRSDFRIIAATNKDLWEEVKKGTFRQDLYYRLHVFPIYIPPLRERREDIVPLVNHFLKRYGQKYGKRIRHIPSSEWSKLLNYPWPGNVRELKHVIERAVILSNGSTITFDLAPQVVPRAEEGAGDGGVKPLEQVEKEYIEKVLNLTGWRVSGSKGAAALLGIKPSTLRFRMKKLGIKRPSADLP